MHRLGTVVAVLRLLVDTSVWLDTAKDIRGERLVAAVRTLAHQRQLELLVPQVIIDEYDRTAATSRPASPRAHAHMCARSGRRWPNTAAASATTS